MGRCSRLAYTVNMYMGYHANSRLYGDRKRHPHISCTSTSKVGGHAAEDQNQVPTSSWCIYHSGSVHMTLFGP